MYAPALPRPTPWGSCTTPPTFPYLEEARVEFLKSIGHPYQDVRAGGVDFATLEASVQYRKALYFDDEVDVALVVGAVTRATFQVAYLLSVGGDVRATAVTVHGAVDTAAGRRVCPPGYARNSGRRS